MNLPGIKINVLSIFCVILFSKAALSASNDLTLQPEASGYDVTLAVLRKISRAGIFKNDFFFFHRIALIATRFGADPKTYQEDNPNRGIWQLNEAQFEETLTNSNLSEFRMKIGEAFPADVGDWTQVTWDDLLKPLHNGLAFQLYSETLLDRSNINPYFQYIPSLLEDQGTFYQTNFNTSSQINEFINEISNFEVNPECNLEVDIVFVQDASCTVFEESFTETKNLFMAIVDTFRFENIRVGHVVYSSIIQSTFDLDNGYTEDELRIQLTRARRPMATYTLTASGIAQGLAMFETAPTREGVARVILVTTDGPSIEALDGVSNETLAAGITTFATGMSYGWELSEDQLLTIAHNKLGNVLKNGMTINVASEFLYRAYLSVCATPIVLGSGVISTGIVGLNEKRNFKINLEDSSISGVNVTLGTTQGQARAFYSYSEETPNSAVNDGEIQPSNVGTVIPRDDAFGQIFIAVEGLAVDSAYEIIATYLV